MLHITLCKFQLFFSCNLYALVLNLGVAVHALHEELELNLDLAVHALHEELELLRRFGFCASSVNARAQR